MEKKRVFSKSLILLAITSIMLFAMSITSMAATETDRSNKEFYIYGMGSSSRCIILSDTHMGKL